MSTSTAPCEGIHVLMIGPGIDTAHVLMVGRPAATFFPNTGNAATSNSSSWLWAGTHGG